MQQRYPAPLELRPIAPAPDTAWILVFAAWLTATVSTLGALFFGEVMNVPTCVLCWYQRIFMFPLVLILAFGLFPLDTRVVRYALPLACIGWAIALFHVLLVAGYIPERVQPCAQGVPCSETYVEWFGFVTIPLLALVAFSIIIALLFTAHIKARS
jgi:disulfide bond formation protein DsbB